MRGWVIIFLFLCCHIRAQNDKLFLKDGSTKTGTVVSIGNDFVLCKTDSLNNLYRILKTEILMLEKYNGQVLVFGKKTIVKDSVIPLKYQHSVGTHPVSVFLGRLTFYYEHLNKNGSVGIMIPLSVTFDPKENLYAGNGNGATIKNRQGINFIGGADVNFYIGKGDYKGFFIGPRVRYGMDMFLEIEGYSLQTQVGWRLSEPDDRISQLFSVGFGFARILSSQAGNQIDPKQSYGWGSINYRVGFNW